MSDAVKNNLSRQIKGNFMRNVKLYTHWKCMICRSAWKMNRALIIHTYTKGVTGARHQIQVLIKFVYEGIKSNGLLYV